MEVQLAPITANHDVLKLYHKQKSEFHFQQKSDNEFLVFLLNVAMKAITFVYQIKPDLIDACSDDSNDRYNKKPGDGTNSHIVSAPPKAIPPPEEEMRQRNLSSERPAKSQRHSFGGLPPFKSYTDTSFQRQSEILQRQHEIISRQVESFPFPTLPDTVIAGTGIPPLSANVIKPTFVTKDGPRRIKLKSSSQGSPVTTSNTSDCEKVMGEGEETVGDKDESSMDTSSTPTTPHPREYRARSEASSLPSGTRQLLHVTSTPSVTPTLDFHDLSPSKIRDHGLLEQKSRVLDMTKIGSTTIPSMAYMFSDKLATSAENTSDNVSQRSHHIGNMQWASEYKFDGSALHIMNGRNSRKPRTVFTWEQLKQMEETFKQKKYLCTEDRMILAQKLDLTDEQIKVWFQNRRQKWKKGGSKDDEVIEYSQYYDLFSRDGAQLQHENDNENNTRTINMPDHLRMKTEQMQCLSSVDTHRALIEQNLLKSDDLSRSIIDLKQSAHTDNEERSMIREQQMRVVAAADEANNRSPAGHPTQHAVSE